MVFFYRKMSTTKINVRSAKKNYKMTRDEECVLINFMQENTFMWDVSNDEYKNTAKKLAYWKNLSETLNKDGMYFSYSIDSKLHREINYILYLFILSLNFKTPNTPKTIAPPVETSSKCKVYRMPTVV